MSSSTKQRLFIKTPSDPILSGALQEFLLPKIKRGLAEYGNLTMEISGNSVIVYTSPFDPEFVFSKQKHAGALWTGYSTEMEKYITAQDENAAFWLVPSVNAYHSFVYYTGKSKQEWSPRVMVIPEIRSDSIETPKMSEEAKEFAEINKVTDSIVLSLWVDFDGEANYIQKVMTFIRLFQEAHKLRETHEVDLMFLLYNATNQEINLEDWGVAENGIPVVSTTDPLVLEYYGDYYFSLSTCPTVYDPMCESLHDLRHSLANVYAPLRMDTVNLLNVRELDKLLSRMISSLVQPGSTGIGAMMGTMKQIHEDFLNQVIEDLLNSGMQHLVKKSPE